MSLPPSPDSPVLAAVRSAGCGPLLAGPGHDARPLRLQVFDHLRATGGAARADVARALGISAGTVTALTADLIALDLIEEVDTDAPPQPPGQPQPQTQPGRGRPPVALRVRGQAARVAGVKLSDAAHSAVLTDLAGIRLAEAVLPAAPGRKTVAALVAELATLVDALCAAAGLPRGAIDCIGVGLPGVVDHGSDRVLWSPLLVDGETGTLTALARDALGRPVLVDNDANMLALAELWFGAGRARADFAVVTIEHGVGMGLVLGNRLWRGARGMGMELGHIKVQLDGALCRCGQRGCLEAYLADYALAREAATALGLDPQAGARPALMLDALVGAARGGHGAARAIFDRAGRYLAVGLANVVQLFDPALIVLSGARMAQDVFDAEAVLSQMADLTLPHGRRDCAVEVQAWDDLVWANGAAALALAAVSERKVLGTA